jgi:hypothetical protein
LTLNYDTLILTPNDVILTSTILAHFLVMLVQWLKGFVCPLRVLNIANKALFTLRSIFCTAWIKLVPIPLFSVKFHFTLLWWWWKFRLISHSFSQSFSQSFSHRVNFPGGVYDLCSQWFIVLSQYFEGCLGNFSWLIYIFRYSFAKFTKILRNCFRYCNFL